MGRRTLLIISAILVATLGTAAVFLYANNAQKQAVADQNPVTVVVAKAPIQIGTVGKTAADAGAFEEKTLPASAVAPGALADTSSIQTLVAQVPVQPGQQVLASMFGNLNASNGLEIPAGKVASSVQLGDPQRVAGFLAPGSQVAVFVTMPETEKQSSYTRLVLTRVPVIAVGPATVTTRTSGSGDQANTEQIPTAILTLGVSQKEAEKLGLANEVGKVFFTLIDKNSKVAPSAGTSVNDLFTS